MTAFEASQEIHSLKARSKNVFAVKHKAFIAQISRMELNNEKFLVQLLREEQNE